MSPNAPDEKNFESLKYLETVIENVTDIVTLVEASGKIRYESSSLSPILGYKPEELVGTNVFDLVHPEDYARVFKIFMTSLIKKDVIEKVEVRYKHKDGSWRYIECVGKNLLFDSRVKAVVLCSRDITERREAWAQIRLQSKALEAAANGIVITDSQGVMLWVNPAFTRMSGYSFDEALGRNPRILKSGEQNPKTYEELWATILAGRTWQGELINRRKDGSLYFEDQMITPVKNKKGRITHFIAIKQDISANKKMEAQFRQTQKMEAVGRLAGGIAHDFNNLLTIILGESDMALSQLPEGPLHRSITEIKNAGNRAANLTRQLLAFSRKQIFQIKVIDLNEVLQGMDKLIRRLLGEDIELVTLLGQNLRPVKVDTAQMEQVIMNLAVNARDAMPEGGKLVIETSQVKVDKKTAAHYPGFQPGDYICLKVQDSGSGITPEVKAHMFEPFFTTKEGGKGTGLGLATIFGIVKQSKGFIYADSEWGKGTSFLVFLPPSEEEISKQNETQIPTFPTRHETVLIAEDEDLVRGLAVQVLSRQGFQVLEARNGLEALRVARESNGKTPLHLLVTDMVMPYMGGGELAKKFLAEFPKTRIIFTSGYTNHSAVQKWIDQGALFLQKPYTHSELLHTVRETLDKPND